LFPCGQGADEADELTFDFVGLMLQNLTLLSRNRTAEEDRAIGIGGIGKSSSAREHR